MIIEYTVFYAIKKALGLDDEEIKYSYSPFCLNAKVESKYSKCKQIVIYGDSKEVDIFCEKIGDTAITELGKMGPFTIKPIEVPEEGELKITPIIKKGICLHMIWH